MAAARDGRLGGARSPQAPSRHAAHPGARRHRRRERKAATRCAPGAVAFLEKPVEKSLLDEAFSQISGFLDRRVRNLLVVDDESAQRQALDRAARRRRGHQRHRGRLERGGARRARAGAVRLHGARPEAARYAGLSAARARQVRRAVLEGAGDHLHGEAAHAQGGDGAAPLRRDDRRQGRELTRAAARRDDALPPSRRVAPSGGEAEAAAAAAQRRRGLRGQEGADRRRRRAQRLRADQRARGPPDGRPLRRERARRAQAARATIRTSTSS